MAHAMGATAAMEAHRAEPANLGALRVANQMLDAARNALQGLERHPDAPAPNPKFLTYLHLKV